MTAKKMIDTFLRTEVNYPLLDRLHRIIYFLDNIEHPEIKEYEDVLKQRKKIIQFEIENYINKDRWSKNE